MSKTIRRRHDYHATGKYPRWNRQVSKSDLMMLCNGVFTSVSVVPDVSSRKRSAPAKVRSSIR